MRNRQFQLGFGTQIIIFLCVISNFTLGIYANTHLICSSVYIYIYESNAYVYINVKITTGYVY